MSQLVLIDHSLKGVGGHHFEYAYHILAEATKRGRDVILATHRDFQPGATLPGDWQVHPVFQQDTYSPHSVYFRHPYKPGKPRGNNRGGILGAVRDWWTARVQAQHRNKFAAACDALFQQVKLSAGDEVFIPTLSELDMAGLIDFLSRCPQPAGVNWRLQFHFDVCDGRPHEFAAQAARGESMRASLLDSIERAGEANLHFYNTTHELTAQYNSLNTAAFQTLHYPVNPRFSPRELPPGKAADRCLRVTCGGYFRREKGRKRFAKLIADLAPDLLSQKAIQLSAQCKPRQMSKILRGAPDASSIPDNSVVCAPHPLGVDEYVEYIRQSDIGLFLYDGRRYFSRCSGVLVEMLAAGVPVITPAACWLEEQFASENQRYLRETLAGESPLSTTTSESVRFTSSPVELFSALRLKQTADAIVTLNWGSLTADETPSSARLKCTQLDGSGAIIDEHHQVLRATQQPSTALFPLDNRCRTIRVTAETAYGDAAQELAAALHQLAAPTGSAHRPMGSIGLSFDREEDIAALIRDMVRHHDHYQQSARRFAENWRRKHSPAAVLDRFADAHPAESRQERAA